MPPPSQSRKPKKKRSFLDTLIKIAALLVSTTWIFFLLGWLYLAEFYNSFGIALNVNIVELPFHEPVIFSVAPISGLIPLFNWASVIGGFVTVLWIFQQEFTALLQRFPWILLIFVVTYLSIITWISKHETIAWCIFGIGILLAIFWRVGWLRPLLNKARQPSTSLAGQPVPPWRQRLEQAMTWLSRVIWMVILPLGLILSATGVAIRMGQEEGQVWHRHPAAKTKNVCLRFKRGEESLFDPELINANSSGKLMLLVQTKEFVFVFATNDYGKVQRGVFIIPIANLQSVNNDNTCLNPSPKIANPPATPHKLKPKRRPQRPRVPCEV